MGNLFSKSNKVSPLNVRHKESEMNTNSRPTKKWYRSLLCYYKNAVAATTSLAQDVAPKNSNRKLVGGNELNNESDLLIEGCHDDDVNSSAELVLIEPKKFESSSAKLRLPVDEEFEEWRAVRSKTVVKRNEVGRARSIAFNIELLEVDMLNRPQSSLSMDQQASRPRMLASRLPELSTVTKEEIERKLSQAVERRDALLRDRSERIRERSALSKEMLGRLEAEKQRLLKEKIEEKERKAVDKKERLKRRKERKAARQTRRTERAKANAAEKEKQVCVNAEEALKEKMRAAEGKKAEIMLERESKRNIHRFKQIRAELIKLNETGTKDRSTLEDRNENILGQGRQEAMRCKTALDKVYALLEQSAEEEVNLETFDGDSNNVFAEEPEITEITKDPFWDC
eukprot:gene2117-17701_t